MSGGLFESYEDGRVSIVHDVVAEPRARGGHPARGEALVDGQDAVGDVNPYQPVKPGDGSASQSRKSSEEGDKGHE